MDYKSILEYDNNPEMINSWMGDYHVWFDIRYEILYAILCAQTNANNPDYRIRKYSLFVKVKHMLLSLFHFPFFPKKKEMIFFSSNIVNMKEGRRYYNRLYDFFCEKIPSAYLIERSHNRSYRRPRYSHVYYFDWINIKRSFRKRLDLLFFRNVKKDNLNQLDEIINNIRNRIEYQFDDLYWDSIKENAKSRYSQYQSDKVEYRKFLQKVSPKIIFKEDASYGRSQVLGSLCREFGIRFAEFQHGMIAPMHLAYNYGHSFFEHPRLRKLLPDYLLTFGDFWSNRVTTPSEKVVIGFPYLNEKSKKRSLLKKEVKEILIVSDGELNSYYINLIKDISPFCNEYKYRIIFKLHPAEVPFLESHYKELLSFDNLEIKTYEPIYDLLSIVDIVVGSFSTVMYEALAFNHKPYIHKNIISENYIDFSYFNVFESTEDLITQLQNHHESHEEYPRNSEIWADDSYNKFLRFLGRLDE